MRSVSRITCFLPGVLLLSVLVSSQPPKRANLIASTPFVTVKPGANVTLTCLAYRIAVDPLFNWVVWKFKGTELQDTERIKKSNKFAGDTGNITVSISNVTGDDEGVYTCYMYVDGDRGSMRDINLTIEDKKSRGALNTVGSLSADAVTTLATNVEQRLLENYSSVLQVTQRPWTTIGKEMETGEFKSQTSERTATVEGTEASKSTLSPTALIMLSMGGGVLVVLVTVHLYYKKKKAGPNNGHPIGEIKEYKYDVFITYRSKDAEEWVKETLLPLLDNNNLKYCVHDIHWEPGRLINEHMVESVYHSRMVLALLSKNYMKSHFCKEELHYAIYRNLEKGDQSLIVLKIDDINIKRIPKEIRNRTFIDTSWKDWKNKLVKALKTYYKKIETISEV